MKPQLDVLRGDDVTVSGWGEAPSWGVGVMVLSPAQGRWFPSVTSGFVEPDQAVGEIRMGSDTEPVRAPYRGQVLHVLAHAGHPVETGRPLLWMERAS
jgi:acetyl/propionyl-CoA carboxylase alpha subunit